MRTTPALALIVLCEAAGAAHAALSQAVITPPGGFVQAAAYPTTNGCVASALPGNDITTGCGTGADFDEQAFGGSGSASASAANSAPGPFGPINQSISGTAGLGYVRAQGSNAYTDYTSFANAVLDGGWNESFTVSHPSLNGQSGYMVFRLHAQGQMHTQGLSGSAVLEVRPYKNHSPIPWNAYYAEEGSDSGSMSGGNQSARWGLASYGLPDNRSVDSYVTMSVPITFGTPFTLGIYARFVAGQRSSGGFNDPSSDWLDFSTRGVEWAGIVGVRNAGGAVVSGSTIISGSGIDWLPPISSCDSIDFNGDGLFPDTADIDAFLAVFSGGTC